MSPTMITVTPSCLRLLGWPRVLETVADACATEPGREAAAELSFLADHGAVVDELARVGEAMNLRRADASLPLDGVEDIRRIVARCQRGSVEGADELIAVARTARAIVTVRRHLKHHAPEAPQLAGSLARLEDVGLLASELEQTFDESGRIRDDASPELAEARRRAHGLHQAIKERLDCYLQRAELTDVLQDTFYTQREDRYVVPVIASFQSQVPGIIHGTSNSGQTVFIEPEPFIHANNEIKVAEAAVEREVYRVLQARSQWVAGEADALVMGLEALIDLDLVQARAMMALRLEANVPRVAATGRMELKRARNPLLVLNKVAVVPNDVALEPEHAFVVITGPNTGGKTVTLNTIGLMTLMTWAGLPIPADPDSQVVLFDSLHTIIGDAQDIDRNLSTFSGQLMALQEVLDEAHAGALVLIDEIIVGTEPSQGAALAIAVLEAMARRGARGFVTTHYERLKTLAFEDARFGNASVGIDPMTMQPTYELRMGEPGSSNPFEIAARLGLGDDILTRARQIAGGDEGVARALQSLQEARREAEEAWRDAERAQRDAETEARGYEMLKADLRRRADEEVARARQDALAEARKALETVRDKVRELRQLEDARALERKRAELQAVASELETQLRNEPPPVDPNSRAGKKAQQAAKGPRDGGDLPASAIERGAAVWVRTLGQPGEVVEMRDDKVIVAIGPLKTTVTLQQLGRVAGGASPSPSRPAPAPSPAPRQAAPTAEAERLGEDAEDVPPPQTPDITADIRGMRRDEVTDVVTPLLDRAFRDNREAVWIIHGHGTGALRDEVRDLVRRSSYVTRWRPGRRHEGGDGVTIAWLQRDWD